MTEILSLGRFGKTEKDNIFQSLWHKITNLSTFAKLAIITELAILIAAPHMITGIQTLSQYAAEPQQLNSTALPSSCHLAVDYSTCPQKAACQPAPIVICNSKGK